MRRSARVPASLRRPPTGGAAPRERRCWRQPRADVGPAKLVTTACLLAAAPPTVAIAQSASSANSLPPLNVEAKAAKKTTSSPSGAVTAAAPAAVAEPTPAQKAASPYVDPVAPYKVQASGSSKITEPLADTPKTITEISKEV